MFNNIGGKLKTVAAIETWIGIVIFVIVGGVSMSQGMTGIGLLIMLGGSLISWLSSFIIYGFGQLIENTDIIAGRKKSPVFSNNTAQIQQQKPRFEPKESKHISKTIKIDSPEDLVRYYENGDIDEEQYIELLNEMGDSIKKQYENGTITEKEYRLKMESLENI